MLAIDDGVIEGAVELPLLLIEPDTDKGEKASSGRRRSAGLGKTTVLRDPMVWVATSGG